LKKKSIKEKVGVTDQFEMAEIGVEVAHIFLDKHTESATWMREQHSLIKLQAPAVINRIDPIPTPAPSLSPDMQIAYVNDPSALYSQILSPPPSVVSYYQAFCAACN
jgi:hypothetical protein